MDLPPYGWINQNEEKKGIIFELNEELAKKIGLPYRHEILPFNRMLKMLNDGELDIISSQAHQMALSAGENIAIQHLTDVIAITKKGSAIKTLSELKNKRLIFHHGATYPQLVGLPSHIERVGSYREMVQLLYSHPHLDGGIITEPAYDYWRNDLKLKDSDFGSKIIIEKDKKQWIFVRRGLPPELKERIKKAAIKVFHEKKFEQLVIKYRNGENNEK